MIISEPFLFLQRLQAFMHHTAFLLDVNYVMKEQRSMLRLLLKDEKTQKTIRAYDADYAPYFYLHANAEKETETKLVEELKRLKVYGREGEAKIMDVKMEERLLLGKKTRLLRITCQHPSHVPKLREEVKRFGTTYEDAIQFTKRYMIDKKLYPCQLVQLNVNEKKEATELAPQETPANTTMPIEVTAFDIETYNPQGMPRPEVDPCLMIGYADKTGSQLLTYSKPIAVPNVHNYGSEKDMLEAFSKLLKLKKADLVCTYNGDSFDLPYLRERAKKTHAVMHLGRDTSPPNSRQTGLRVRTSLIGRIHFDVFPVVSLLSYIGAYKMQRLTLKAVYKEILGGKKEDIEKYEIWKTWDQGTEEEMKHLFKYCRVDAEAAYQLADHLLPLEIELSRITGNTLFETARATPGQLVESLLMRRAFEGGEIILNKPDYEEVKQRSENPVEGAFVQLPSPGIYDHIAVLDFRSLYPSIIISHNIDPSTINCSCCTEKEAYLSPKGHRFCKKRKGLIPKTLQHVLEARIAIKQQMKTLKKEGKTDSTLFKQLDARQTALKILANSTYGYLLYARSRYYSRECGESVTAWGRHYVQETLKKAGEAGLKPLYADTDSAFLLYGKPENENKVTAFQKRINAELPESMELELEDIYPRGIFVSKKQEEKGAKKKYALINREGKIKIRGFELVRRDWSRIAKETQREVIQILLGEGDVEKARQIVREVVERLKEGKVPLEELAIYTQLKKKAKSYEIMSPEVSAFLKAQKAGVRMDEKSVIAYVITKKGKSISDRAEILERAKDYDPEYYINNQVLPAVLRIMGAMGFEKEDLKTKGRQKSLGDW
ncbi:DNA-directed DNA polymerase [Candidatus Micrarchaeota archaeon]|nr:DNA-directed DNA polymerase [Candidatus Micrarchaeota archaeon]